MADSLHERFGRDSCRHPYALAIVFVAAATVGQLLAEPYVQPTPFLMYFGAVMAANRWCGLRPGLLATAASMVVVFLLFLPKEDGHHTRNVVSLLLFSLSSGFITLLAEDLRRARARALRAADELRRVNEQLEQRVEERTRALQAALRELESFSYSVAHDLRAPLRAVDGYAQLLGGASTEEAARHVSRIRAAVRRMGLLIDDLLRLSQVSRAELTRARVDLAALAQEALDELAQADPKRRVEVRVEGPASVEGDPAMLRVVVQNLISNAWKFTGRTDDARIEVRRVSEPGFEGIDVRDNGAGFDPAGADRMFEPLERLHSQSEFEGTGIGLALCRRIITRHGGTIRATGTPGGGATLSVRLPAR